MSIELVFVMQPSSLMKAVIVAAAICCSLCRNLRLASPVRNAICQPPAILQTLSNVLSSHYPQLEYSPPSPAMAPSQSISSAKSPSPLFITSAIRQFVPYIIVLLFFILLFTIAVISFSLLRRRHRNRESPPRVMRLPWMLSRQAPSDFKSTVAALLIQSLLMATSLIRLGVLPEKLDGKTVWRRSMDFACRGLRRPLSWGQARVGLFGRDASPTSSESDPELVHGLQLQSEATIAKLPEAHGQSRLQLPSDDERKQKRPAQVFGLGQPLADVATRYHSWRFNTVRPADAFDNDPDRLPPPHPPTPFQGSPVALDLSKLCSDDCSYRVSLEDLDSDSCYSCTNSAATTECELITGYLVVNVALPGAPMIKVTFPSSEHVTRYDPEDACFDCDHLTEDGVLRLGTAPDVQEIPRTCSEFNGHVASVPTTACASSTCTSSHLLAPHSTCALPMLPVLPPPAFLHDNFDDVDDGSARMSVPGLAARCASKQVAPCPSARIPRMRTRPTITTSPLVETVIEEL